MLIKLHNIFINLLRVSDMLSFNMTSVFRPFVNIATFVYMWSPCSLEFDNS